MPTKLDPDLIEEFKALLRSEGLQDVSRWVLPNDDAPVDEDALLKRFEQQIDGLFALTGDAMTLMAESRNGDKH